MGSNYENHVWKGESDSAVATDGLHTLMATPVIDGGYIYGVDSFGQLRCLRLQRLGGGHQLATKGKTIVAQLRHDRRSTRS